MLHVHKKTCYMQDMLHVHKKLIKCKRMNKHHLSCIPIHRKISTIKLSFNTSTFYIISFPTLTFADWSLALFHFLVTNSGLLDALNKLNIF